MPVLVDTSVWIEYFRKGKKSSQLDVLIDENIVVINDLIIAELAPSLKVRNQTEVVGLLRNLEKLDLSIDWDEIIEFQTDCLRNGINGVSIPDLLIAQNAKQNCCEIYSFDGHFKLMKDRLKLRLLE